MLDLTLEAFDGDLSKRAGGNDEVGGSGHLLIRGGKHCFADGKRREEEQGAEGTKKALVGAYLEETLLQVGR
jgi:hypothetical protein